MHLAVLSNLITTVTLEGKHYCHFMSIGQCGTEGPGVNAFHKVPETQWLSKPGIIRGHCIWKRSAIIFIFMITLEKE